VTFLFEPEANLMFFEPAHCTKKGAGGGRAYYVMGSLDGDDDEPVMGRLVCDWSVGFDGVDAFLEALKN
jgi:threonine aldolase